MSWTRTIFSKMYVTPTIQSCKVGTGFSVRAGFGLKFVKIFRADFGPAYKIYSQRGTLLSPVTVEAIALIKSSRENDYLCVIHSCLLCYATNTRSCAYLDSLGNLAFGPKLRFKNKCLDSVFKMRPVSNSATIFAT